MNLQIIYPEKCFEPSTPEYHNGWYDEIAAMRKIGLSVSTEPSPDAKKLLLRSYIIHKEKDFPNAPRYISRWTDYTSIRNMDNYLYLIEDITIPSFITPVLNQTTEEEIRKRGWERAFIRSREKSLKYMFPESQTEDKLPVWPDVSMESLSKAYQDAMESMKPPYVVRKYMPENIMHQEERYWVLNNHIYHRTGIIPPVVTEAAKRLQVLNAPYYVIDATPTFIIELNAGVSSDAYPENIPDYFPKWIKQEFDT